ncbi:putative transcription factor [Glycine soja]
MGGLRLQRVSLAAQTMRLTIPGLRLTISCNQPDKHNHIFNQGKLKSKQEKRERACLVNQFCQTNEQYKISCSQCTTSVVNAPFHTMMQHAESSNLKVDQEFEEKTLLCLTLAFFGFLTPPSDDESQEDEEYEEDDDEDNMPSPSTALGVTVAVPNSFVSNGGIDTPILKPTATIVLADSSNPKRANRGEKAATADQIKSKLQLNFNKNQLVEKIRRLKKKYRNILNKICSDKEFSFKSAHDQATFEISRNPILNFSHVILKNETIFRNSTEKKTPKRSRPQPTVKIEPNELSAK